MSSFFTTQNSNYDRGFTGGGEQTQTQIPPQLPSYNNNYEQRFQDLQNNSSQQTYGVPTASLYASPQPQQMSINVYEVRFKCTKGDYLLTDSRCVKPGEFVKVEADRGYDIGIIFKKKAMKVGMEIPRKRILGHIGPEEMSILPHKIAEEMQAVAICRQMAVQRGLQITIADVEFQFDRNKLTVIFASEGRVDFRELVRDMFSFFRIRIWMQKVSPSEAMALLELAASDRAVAGGVGMGVGMGGDRDSRGNSVSPPRGGRTTTPLDRTGSETSVDSQGGKSIDSHSSNNSMGSIGPRSKSPAFTAPGLLGTPALPGTQSVSSASTSYHNRHHLHQTVNNSVSPFGGGAFSGSPPVISSEWNMTNNYHLSHPHDHYQKSQVTTLSSGSSKGVHDGMMTHDGGTSHLFASDLHSHHQRQQFPTHSLSGDSRYSPQLSQSSSPPTKAFDHLSLSHSPTDYSIPTSSVLAPSSSLQSAPAGSSPPDSATSTAQSE